MPSKKCAQDVHFFVSSPTYIMRPSSMNRASINDLTRAHYQYNNSIIRTYIHHL